MNLKLSLFDNKRDSMPKSVTRTWPQMCKRFAQPRVRNEKDGLLFSPASFSKPRRLNENVTELSMIVLDYDHNVAFDGLVERLGHLNCAFAIYSTHSHLRVTERNSNGESRFRVVVPLAAPISAANFPALWRWACLETGLLADEQAKDLSRMYYTPTKASDDAPYQYHIEDGEFLDWRELDLSEQAVSGKSGTEPTPAPRDRVSGETFTYREDRHAELARRIMARGKLNSRGHYDAACLAHDGKGKTSLVYFPESGAVVCNARCDYYEILKAEGLPARRLPSKESKSAIAGETTALQVRRMSDVEPEEVRWLWHPYIPLAKLTILEGDPGVGKSWITAALACAVSLGHGLSDMAITESGNVLMLTAEDGLGDTLRPRLDGVGADVSRIYALDEPLTFDAGGLVRLEAAIIEYSPVLVVIDPLFAYTGGKVDIHRANECRAITARLAGITDKHDCAIVAVRHLGKSRGLGHALNAGIGSIDLVAAARSVLLAGIDSEDESKRAIVHIKSNLAPPGEAISYMIEGSQFYWCGPSDVTAARILSVRSDQEGVDAAAALRDLLTDGPRPAKEAEKEMRAAGFTKEQTRRARERLHICPRKKGFGKQASWHWELPDSEDAGDAEDGGKDGEKSESCHLRVNGDNKSTYANDLAEDGKDSELCHLRADQLPSLESGDLVVGEI